MISLEDEIPTKLLSDSRSAKKSMINTRGSDPELKTGVPATAQSVVDTNPSGREILGTEVEENQDSSMVGEVRVRERSLGSWRSSEQDCGRERLKRHRLEMAGRVCVPETWGKESLLMNWGADCSVFQNLRLNGLMVARKALVDECRQSSGNHHHHRQ